MVDFTGGTWRSLIDGSEVSAIPDPDTYQGYTLNEFPPDPYTNLVDGNIFVSDDQSLQDGQSLLFDMSDNTGIDSGVLALVESDMSDGRFEEVRMSYWERSSAAGGALRWLDDNDEELISVGTANPEVTVIHGNEEKEILESDPSPNYEAWRTIILSIDWDGGTVDMTWEDIDGSTSTQTASNLSFIGNPDNIAKAQFLVDRRDDAGMGGSSTSPAISNMHFDVTSTL